MCKYSLYALLFLLLIYFFPQDSIAHESRPLYIEITELKQDIYSINVKTPKSVPDFNIPKFNAPDNCGIIGKELKTNVSDSYISKQNLKCDGTISGKTVKIEYPILNPSVSTLIRINFLSGEKHNKLLNPKKLSWEIPDQENRFGVAKEYSMLGIRHILEGIDHLLFLVCIIIIAGTGRRILITITGFTIAHSITLILSALNLVKIPVPPVEASIALSIVFVATEIAKGTKDTLTYKYPITVSTSFGLLHGFGFAAVLNQIGLPQVEIPTSLLFFNLGVEIGQLIFISIIIVLFFSLKFLFKQSITNLIRYEKPAAYIIGSLASLWMIQRIYSFWY